MEVVGPGVKVTDFILNDRGGNHSDRFPGGIELIVV
jgi:hypothetical protein